MAAPRFPLRAGRPQLLCWLFAALVAVSTLTRLALLAADPTSATLAATLPRGFALDAAVSVLMLTPLALALSLSSGRWIAKRAFRAALIATIVGAAVFSGFVEYFFFEEFEARFNHVALDYLLYPGEVAGNVWESYPVPLYVGLALVAGGFAAWSIDRRLRGFAFELEPWRSRLQAAGVVLAAAGLASAALAWMPDPSASDRRVAEIGSNGWVELVRAFKTAGLDYESFYRTVPEAERARWAQSELGWTKPDDPHRAFAAFDRREPSARPREFADRPLDVVVIIGESFGSEFVGALGGRRNCTPGFDRWAKRGLLLSNVVPTGNRTVRGLEGVLCSFVPLPGDSIWKRDKSDDVATLARVLQGQGYRTEFVYGGDGAFDGMRSFALRNGYGAFLEDSLIGDSSYPKDAFRTIWGVADEHLFDRLLDRQRSAKAEGVPFFATALTVSNHKPFLTPDSASFGLRGDKLLASGGFALALLVISIVAWRAGRVRARHATIATLSLAWLILGVGAWSEAQPRDSRESAVRYADRALAQYLDEAEASGLLDHTVVLFVGDHGARVYGSERIPVASYRVPALFVCPGSSRDGTVIPRLCSQIDLAPTLLSLAGVDAVAPFFGADLLRLDPDGPGRAFVIHNRDIGLLTDQTLTVLGLRKTITCYRRADRASDEFVQVEGPGACPQEADRAAAVFQSASNLYETGRYRLEHGP